MNYALLIGSILGLFGILLGAYGDHALQAQFSAADLQSWDTALSYHHMYTLVILVFAALCGLPNQDKLRGLYYNVALFAVGVILFSGSIYLRILTGYDGLTWLTPVGGFILIAGWLQAFLTAMLWNK